MKFVERAVLTILGIVVLFALHQVVGGLVARHNWKGLAPSDWAAWVQAVGSIGAIFAAGAIATYQARRQYQDGEVLRRAAESAAALRIAKAVTAIASNAVERTFTFISTLGWDRQNVTEIAEGRKHFDRNSIKRILSDLDSVPLQDLPTAEMIARVIRMRSIVRQLDELVDLAFQNVSTMNAAAFTRVFDILDDGHFKLCHASIAIESEVSKLS